MNIFKVEVLHTDFYVGAINKEVRKKDKRYSCGYRVVGHKPTAVVGLSFKISTGTSGFPELRKVGTVFGTSFLGDYCMVSVDNTNNTAQLMPMERTKEIGAFGIGQELDLYIKARPFIGESSRP